LCWHEPKAKRGQRMTPRQETELLERVVACETLCKRLIGENQETRALLNTILDRLFVLTEPLGQSSDQFEEDCHRSLQRAFADDRIRTAPVSEAEIEATEGKTGRFLRMSHDPSDV
jgi:ribosome assembly protein YihI (activator of Der GTPase)